MRQLHETEPIAPRLLNPTIPRDGQRIVTGSIDHTAKVWEASTGKLRLTLQHSAGITSVAYSKDGQRIATGSFDHRARVWDATTGLALRNIKAHNSPLLALNPCETSAIQ